MNGLMKRLLTTYVIVLSAFLTVAAQNKKPEKFSPERFQADLEQFITKEACLTAKEAATFFPIYKEMQAKQRAVFERQRQLGMVKPADEKGCEEAIRQRDEYDLELKSIQKNYHNKFLGVLSASKLYDVLKAEDRFHRQMLRGWNRGRNHGQQQKKMER
jgi:hypothetical protein